MNSRDLARLLLTLPDLPVAVSAHGHTYSSVAHELSHGPLMIGKSALGYRKPDGGDMSHIVVGDMLLYLREAVFAVLHSGRD